MSLTLGYLSRIQVHAVHDHGQRIKPFFLLDYMKFTPDQVLEAIPKYGLYPDKMDSCLKEFCKVPFILRLLSRRYTSDMIDPLHTMYPSPTDMQSFYPIFASDGEPEPDTILGRLGIMDAESVMLLSKVLMKFKDIDKPTKVGEFNDEIDAKELENNKETWTKIISAGLLTQQIKASSVEISIKPTNSKETPKYPGLLAEWLRRGKNQAGWVINQDNKHNRRVNGAKSLMAGKKWVEAR